MYLLKMSALVALSALNVCATSGAAEAGRIYYSKNGTSIGSTRTVLAGKRLPPRERPSNVARLRRQRLSQSPRAALRPLR
jgi:uncharacterized membrane protein